MALPRTVPRHGLAEFVDPLQADSNRHDLGSDPIGFLRPQQPINPYGAPERHKRLAFLLELRHAVGLTWRFARKSPAFLFPSGTSMHWPTGVACRLIAGW